MFFLNINTNLPNYKVLTIKNPTKFSWAHVHFAGLVLVIV